MKLLTDNQTAIDAQIKKTYGAQNLHILTSIGRAHAATCRLIEQGFVVLEARIGTRNPVFVVQNNAAAGQLKGVTRVRRMGSAGHERIKVAKFEGVQIEWIERGH